MNSTTVNSTSVTVCETAGNATNCPWYSYLNATAFTCLGSCSTFYFGQQCYAACPASAPLVASAGSLACVTSCSSNVYFLNGSINQCNATCAQPDGITTTLLGSTGAYLCQTCTSPNFIQRSNSSCVTSCTYVNSTTVNSTAVTICEVNTDTTNCHYQQYLNATAYTCLSTCGNVISGTICCPAAAPLVASVGSQVCIATCSPTLYIANGSINQCNATCALPFGIQTTSLGSPATFICSACVSPKFV